MSLWKKKKKSTKINMNNKQLKFEQDPNKLGVRHNSKFDNDLELNISNSNSKRKGKSFFKKLLFAR